MVIPVLSIMAGDSILPFLGHFSIILAAGISVYHILNNKIFSSRANNLTFFFQALPFLLLIYAFLFNIKSQPDFKI